MFKLARVLVKLQQDLQCPLHRQGRQRWPMQAVVVATGRCRASSIEGALSLLLQLLVQLLLQLLLLLPLQQMGFQQLYETIQQLWPQLWRLQGH